MIRTIEASNRIDGMDLNLSLRRAARDFGNHCATIYNGRKRSWRDTHLRVEHLAGALEKLGVGKGDRVAGLAFNSDNYLELFYAVWRIGAVMVPLNSRWSVAENTYALNDSGAKILFSSEEYKAIEEQLLSQTDVSTIVRIGDSDGSCMCTEGLIHASESPNHVDVGAGDLAAIFYTGGTTGFPKGVMLSHGGLIVSALSFAPVMKADQESRYLHGPPFFHMAAGTAIVMMTMFAATHIILDRFDEKSALSALAEHRATHGLFVPSMVQMFIAELKQNPVDVSSLKTMIYGASPMPEATIRAALQAFPDTEFVQAYGQTELSPFATALRHSDHILEGPLSNRLRSAGRTIPNCEIKITDENGTPLPTGEIGEICVRGPNVMLGYWNKPKETADTIVGGWCRTGDAGYFDEDRYLYIADRVKDMIISGGENVYSAEVENAVMSYPDVIECAVIGIPSEEWGESVHAIVHVSDGSEITFEKLYVHCKSLIAGYKCPKSFEVHDGPLPLTPIGKISKKALRAPFWEERKRNVN